jgi:hypothetical protein
MSILGSILRRFRPKPEATVWLIERRRRPSGLWMPVRWSSIRQLAEAKMESERRWWKGYEFRVRPYDRRPL